MKRFNSNFNKCCMKFMPIKTINMQTLDVCTYLYNNERIIKILIFGILNNTPPRWQVAPSAWRSNGLGIFSPTIDFLTLKKKFIYNCRYNEPFLLFDKPYRVSQKKVHKAFDVWMVPPCQFGRQIAPPEGTFSVRLFGYEFHFHENYYYYF